MAHHLVAKATSPYESLRAIYDWIGQNLKVSEQASGDKGALWALRTKLGDCSEFASLFIALSRAAGIPARTIKGLVYKPDNKETDSNLHAWAEAYISAVGWVPFDPSWGRGGETSDDYFGAITPDYIVIFRGDSPLAASTENNMLCYKWWWEGERASISNTKWSWTIKPI